MDEEEEGSVDDEKSFETVTPEHDTETCKEVETTLNSFPDKHTHILEDVDGELEMEDVSPQCEGEISSTYETTGAATGHAPHYQSDKHDSLGFAPPLPADNPPSPPPLPSSPPPVVPPCPPMLPLVPPPVPAAPCNHGDGLDSHPYAGRNVSTLHLVYNFKAYYQLLQRISLIILSNIDHILFFDRVSSIPCPILVAPV